MTFNSNYCPMTILKIINIMKLNNAYKFELAEVMFQLHHKQLPLTFYDCLTKISKIQNYSTRQKDNGNIKKNLLAFLNKFGFMFYPHKFVFSLQWSARLARKQAFRVRRLLSLSSMMHILP